MEKRWNLPERPRIVKKGSAWRLGGGERGEKGGEEKRERSKGRRCAGAEVLFLIPFFACMSPGAPRPGPPAVGAATRRPPCTPRVSGARPRSPRAASHILVSAGTFRSFIGYCPALTECVGSQRHRRPPCLLGRELTGFAALRQWISLPSTARRMGGSLCLAYFFSYSSE